MLYLSGVNYESINDGEGVRAVFYISGCKHKCKGCHNPSTHSFTNGQKITKELIEEINFELDRRKFLNGITLSGGDPMYSSLEVIEFIKHLHIPKDNIWIYSGFTLEEILSNAEQTQLLNKCNVLIDGMYDESQRDITLLYRGSKNQKIISLNFLDK